MRNTPFMKNFIQKYIKPGNIIISDGWRSYNFLREPRLGYTHLNFYIAYRSCLGFFKSALKKIYHRIPNKGFYFYLKETEFRFKTRNNTFNEKVDRKSVV